MQSQEVVEPRHATRSQTKFKHGYSFPPLLAGAVLLLVADGRNTIPLATWLAPACLLRYVRMRRSWKALLALYAVLVVMRGFEYRGMIPIPGFFYLIFAAISGVSATLPYLADRLLGSRLSGFGRSIVFPCSLVAFQFIYSHGPQGSWGTIAYTQSGNLPLLQLLSVTGIWGITFLIGWFASSVNEALESEPRWTVPITFACVLLSTLLLGGIRLAFFPASSNTVRVAGLSPQYPTADSFDTTIAAVAKNSASQRDMAELRRLSEGIADDLFLRSEREALAGAKIILWSETAIPVLAEDEPLLIRRSRDLAARYHTYFALSIGTWTPTAATPLQNKVVLIDPSGAVQWQYLKARPTPGPEAAAAQKSDGIMRAIDTPYGRISLAICYDLDFPSLLRQVGDMGAGVVLVPSSDWEAIDPRHTEIASYRAIENGFNLVRQANHGRSAVYDYGGHLLAEMDHFRASDRTMVAQVPTSGVRTIYSRLGDWFAWTSIGALILLAGLGFRRSASALVRSQPRMLNSGEETGGKRWVPE